MTQWFCIQARTGREFSVVEDLSGCCSEVVCLTRQATRRGRNQTRFSVNEPLYPGYIFATVPESAWEAVYASKNVIGVVSTIDGPLPLPRAAVGQLQAARRAADAGEFDDASTDGRIQIGDILTVMSGPWEGQKVYVIGKGEHALRCETEFELIGRRPEIIVPYDAVEKGGE